MITFVRWLPVKMDAAGFMSNVPSITIEDVGFVSSVSSGYLLIEDPAPAARGLILCTATLGTCRMDVSIFP